VSLGPTLGFRVDAVLGCVSEIDVDSPQNVCGQVQRFFCLSSPSVFFFCGRRGTGSQEGFSFLYKSTTLAGRALANSPRRVLYLEHESPDCMHMLRSSRKGPKRR